MTIELKKWRMQMLRLTVVIVSLLASPLMAADVDYAKDVKPLLARKCTSCHGALRQKAGLRLDAGKLIHQGSESGKIIDPGKSSRLLDKITATDPAERMPPEGEGEPLTAEQISILKTWIDGGAVFPADEIVLDDPRKHWAYCVPQRPPVPAVHDASWASNPIDAFISVRQREKGVTPLSDVDRATLLRRVYLDLIGLPPTRAELRAFLADESPTAYERVVDRLLDSPRYGERWARHWMDVWRYSDWYGQGEEIHGSQRHMWRWRDWIIESLNDDKPYDRMIVEMLAGDELAPDDPGTVRATAFLARNFFLGNRDVWLDSTVEHTFKAFLGMTINCAKCHDHKYDPLKQTDYYQARAIFEPYQARIDRLPGQADIKLDGVARVYDADLETKTFLYIQGNEKLPDKTKPIEAALPAFFGESLSATPVTLPLPAYYPDGREFVQDETLAAAREKVQHAEAALQSAQTGEAKPGSASRQPDVSQAELTLMQTRLTETKAALASVEARVAADRARHTEPADPNRDELAKVALKSERQHAIATAEIAVLEAERKLKVTQIAKPEDADKAKAAIEREEKALAEARQKLAEAQAAVEKTDGNYTPIGPEYPRTSTGRRLALARWIARRENPLTARVAINHIWLRHFDSPLVERVFDFGLNAPRPLQHELLDWLAVELMDNGWQMKPIHRLIVTSRTYRLASAALPAQESPRSTTGQPAAAGSTDQSAVNIRLDPENRLYWRTNVIRLDAEVVRDSFLSLSGSLDLTFGGPDIDFNLGEKVARRSVYFQHAYEKQVRFMVLFDAANPADCYRRSDSIVPQQALALANSPLALTQARKLARSLSRELQDSAGDDEFTIAAFEQTLTRPPLPEELAACRNFLSQQREQFASKKALTPFERGPEVKIDTSADPRLVRISQRYAATFAAGATEGLEASDDPALRARENLIHVLMNHNDFVTVR